MGASLLSMASTMAPVTDFKAHVQCMQDFHARSMVCNEVCRYWADMVRKLDPQRVAPRHGLPFKGCAVIAEFLDWSNRKARPGHRFSISVAPMSAKAA